MRALRAIAVSVLAGLSSGYAGWCCLPVVVAQAAGTEQSRARLGQAKRYYQPVLAVVGASVGLCLGAFAVAVLLDDCDYAAA